MLERVVETVSDAPVDELVVVLGARATQVTANVKFGGCAGRRLPTLE